MDLSPTGLRDHIEDLIDKHLPSKEKEKSELGEVFTPVSMIETLYKQYPKQVWSNPSLTWLDPAAGIGNFHLVAFMWLMEGLKTVFPNKTKRAEHILEEMLYFVEINPTNVKTCRAIFKTLCPTATLNIHQGSFLTMEPSKLKWPSKFDSIVGNPPYNLGGTGLEGSKRTHIQFTEVGLSLLEPNGFLAYICPPSYREADTPMNQLFQDEKGHFVFIKIYGAQETHKLFHIQGRVDGFIYQTNKQGTTTIDDEYGVVTKGLTLDLTKHIPNFGHTIFAKLYAMVEKEGHVEAFRNTELSSVKAHTFGCKGRNKVLHLITEKGKRVFRTKQEHSLQTTPKLLINGLGVPYVYYDKKGEYGPSQSPVIIVKPSPQIVSLISSKFFSFLAWGLRLTGNNNLPYLFDAVPSLTKTSANAFKTMDDIQKGFHLTKAEVEFIDKHFTAYSYQDKDLIEPCVGSKTRKKRA